MSEERQLFSTRLGVIATTVGSAVGLGNIWRFPYEAGTHGGAAFMLCYIFFVIIIGIPVISAEFIMGRGSRAGILGAYRRQSGSRRWDMAGYAGILAALLILSFYSVVAGWTLEYSITSASGSLFDTTDLHRHDAFGEFISGWKSVAFTLIFLAINGLIMLRGVQKGIERISNILMPLLFVILLLFCVNSFFMPGIDEGLKFLFHVDFSQITPSVVLSAMGQAFFSLSIGLGCMMTYASYFKDDTRLLKSATTTAMLDSLVAILAGLIIFPAVFSFGMSPSEGPTLVFEVLPNIFSHMTGGQFWSTLFFLLLFIASLTSTISMAEIIIAFLCDEWHMKRRPATLLTTFTAMVLGTLCALSFGSLQWLNLFNIFDYLSSNILLPLGGMVVSLFVGWRLDRETFVSQLSFNGKLPAWVSLYLLITLRFIAPACIAAVFIAGLL